MAARALTGDLTIGFGCEECVVMGGRGTARGGLVAAGCEAPGRAAATSGRRCDRMFFDEGLEPRHSLSIVRNLPETILFYAFTDGGPPIF